MMVMKYRPIPQDEWAELENQAYLKIVKELNELNINKTPNDLPNTKIVAGCSEGLNHHHQKTTSSRHHKFSKKRVAARDQKQLSSFLGDGGKP